MTNLEWSGSQHPDAPDCYWQDDETGEAVCAGCASRAAKIGDIQHAPGCPESEGTGYDHG